MSADYLRECNRELKRCFRPQYEQERDVGSLDKIHNDYVVLGSETVVFIHDRWEDILHGMRGAVKSGE
jgi:hypothetical protein